MDAGHLLSAELDYELRVRGIQPVGKRKILRGLLSQERAHRSFIESFIVQPHDDDVDAIKTSLTDLEQKIAAFLSSSGSSEHKGLVSRLIHISDDDEGPVQDLESASELEFEVDDDGGVSITENMIWHEHVSSIATTAGKKLGYLFRARKQFSPSNLRTLYKAQIRPSLKYCSHI
nr:unnamed protein product [Callosobruchus chinensis]